MWHSGAISGWMNGIGIDWFDDLIKDFTRGEIIPNINVKVERKDHLVPFYAVYAVAVHVEATIEDGRLAGLIKVLVVTLLSPTSAYVEV